MNKTGGILALCLSRPDPITPTKPKYTTIDMLDLYQNHKKVKSLFGGNLNRYIYIQDYKPNLVANLVLFISLLNISIGFAPTEVKQLVNVHLLTFLMILILQLIFVSIPTNLSNLSILTIYQPYLLFSSVPDSLYQNMDEKGLIK